MKVPCSVIPVLYGWGGVVVGRQGNVANIQCCQFQFSISKLGSIVCYLPGDKIIMLLLGKYSIMWALNIRSGNDAC